MWAEDADSYMDEWVKYLYFRGEGHVQLLTFSGAVTLTLSHSGYFFLSALPDALVYGLTVLMHGLL